MRGSYRSRTFMNLFPEPASFEAAERMRAAAVTGGGRPPSFVDVPVRGIDFFAARGRLAEALNEWWQEHVPQDSLAVILVMHEPGLERYLAGLDVELVVGVADAGERERYAGMDNVRVEATADPLVLAERAMEAYRDTCFRVEPPGPLFVPRIDDQAPPRARPAQAPAERPVPPPAPPPPLPGAAGWPGQAAAPPPPAPGTDGWPGQAAAPPVTTVPAGSLPDPFTELSAVRPAGQAAPAPGGRHAGDLSRASLLGDVAGRPAGRRPEARGLIALLARMMSRPRPITIPREIGDLVLGLRPSPLVVVPARKGGVGKTVTAGAIAQVVGYAIGETTGSAAIVDQNIGNPDQWGRLDIPTSAATVRQLMAALSSGLDLPPTPAWAKTPALAVYPEDRTSADGYPPGLVQRFVQYMRERHVFMVVDLPNRLPDYSSAEAAICAAYLDLADLVILPTTDDPAALVGVIEYLDTPSVRGKPVVVSYIVSNDRELRRHPMVTDLLEQIRGRVTAIVMVPKSEKATLAVVKGVSILEISPRLRDAYVRLTYTAVRALAG